MIRSDSFSPLLSWFFAARTRFRSSIVISRLPPKEDRRDILQLDLCPTNKILKSRFYPPLSIRRHTHSSSVHILQKALIHARIRRRQVPSMFITCIIVHQLRRRTRSTRIRRHELMRLQQQAHCQFVVVGAHNLASVLLDGFDRLVARSRDIDSDLRVELLFALWSDRLKEGTFARSFTPSLIWWMARASTRSFIVITWDVSIRPASIHCWSLSKLRGA